MFIHGGGAADFTSSFVQQLYGKYLLGNNNNNKCSCAYILAV